MLKKHGKNYSLITAKLKTKTAKQIYEYARNLYKKIEKNPRHIHKALKEKLKPTFKLIWSAREYKLLLEGLKKNMKCWYWIKRTETKLKDKNKIQIAAKLFHLRTKEPKSSLSPVEKEIVAVVRRHAVMRNKCKH